MVIPTGEAIPRPPQLGISFFDVAVEVPQGWLSFNDGVIYRVEGSSFSDGASQTFRRQRITSPYVGGQFTVNAVEDLVEENLTVYCYGYDYIDLQDNIDNLINAFTQFSYQIRIDTDSNRRIWNCDLADYSISYERVFLHNRMVTVKLNVPRQPTVQREIIADG